MHEVRLSPSAAEDFARLLAFLAPKSPPAAAKARVAILNAFSSLNDLPGRGRSIYDDVRELVVPFGRDAFLMRYRFAQDIVTIFEILHSREDR